MFDPTPPDLTQAGLPEPNILTRTLDLLRMNWQHYIIRYSVNDQAEMIQFFRSGGRDAMDLLKNLTSLKMERVDSKSKMGFIDPAYNNWLYFSFTKMWVFAAIVASSITV